MRDIVAVIGGGACAPEDYNRAREVGRLLARKGFTVLTGGLSGVMEAACRGAAEEGGLTVGILPGLDRAAANPWVEVAITTGLSDARNLAVATSGRAVVAIGGGFGTLSEIAFAMKNHVPVVALDSWTLPEHHVPGEAVRLAGTPAEAVEIVESLVRRKKP